jgi:hypothetical protein
VRPYGICKVTKTHYQRKFKKNLPSYKTIQIPQQYITLTNTLPQQIHYFNNSSPQSLSQHHINTTLPQQLRYFNNTLLQQYIISTTSSRSLSHNNTLPTSTSNYLNTTLPQQYITLIIHFWYMTSKSHSLNNRLPQSSPQEVHPFTTTTNTWQQQNIPSTSHWCNKTLPPTVHYSTMHYLLSQQIQYCNKTTITTSTSHYL